MTDYGNARVVKFSDDGEYLFAFGTRTLGYSGLRAPAGIAVIGEQVFVADAIAGRIEVFDQSGNHLDSITASLMSSPEGLSVHSSRTLLVADQNVLYTIDIDSRTVTLLTEFNQRVNLVAGVGDEVVVGVAVGSASWADAGSATAVASRHVAAAAATSFDRRTFDPTHAPFAPDLPARQRLCLPHR